MRPQHGGCRDSVAAISVYMNTFFRISIFILIGTAVLKLIAVSGNHALLGLKDPLFGFLTKRQMILLGAIIEIACVFCLYKRRSDLHALLALCMLATTFTFYRVVLALTGYKGPCACMGNMAEWFGVSDKHLEWASMSTLAFFLTGSYFFIYSALAARGQTKEC